MSPYAVNNKYRGRSNVQRKNFSVDVNFLTPVGRISSIKLIEPECKDAQQLLLLQYKFHKYFKREFKRELLRSIHWFDKREVNYQSKAEQTFCRTAGSEKPFKHLLILS